MTSVGPYLKDGINPVPHRAETNTSKFMGVYWEKTRGRWRAKCKGKALGYYTTEAAAAQAYNVEAERIGRPLNVVVIPPAGAAGAGAGPGASGGAGAGGSAAPKRAAPTTLAAPAPCKKKKRASPTTPASAAMNQTRKLKL